MGFQFSKRKVGRVIDRAGLEIRYTLMGIGGLNPSPSAKGASLSAETRRKSQTWFPSFVSENQVFVVIEYILKKRNLLGFRFKSPFDRARLGSTCKSGDYANDMSDEDEMFYHCFTSFYRK